MSKIEPVAWHHEIEGRPDVISDRVKKLWLNVDLKHVEHYTVPLYPASALAQARREALEAAAQWLNDEGLPWTSAAMVRALVEEESSDE